MATETMPRGCLPRRRRSRLRSDRLTRLAMDLAEELRDEQYPDLRINLERAVETVLKRIAPYLEQTRHQRSEMRMPVAAVRDMNLIRNTLALHLQGLVRRGLSDGQFQTVRRLLRLSSAEQGLVEAVTPLAERSAYEDMPFALQRLCPFDRIAELRDRLSILRGRQWWKLYRGAIKFLQVFDERVAFAHDRLLKLVPEMVARGVRPESRAVWLCRALANDFIDRKRTEEAEQQRETRKSRAAAEAAVKKSVETYPDILEELIAKEEAAAVRAVYDDLLARRDWRIPYIQILRGERTVAEVARSLGVDRRTVESRLPGVRDDLRALCDNFSSDASR